jgi:hypothetical protein
MLTARVAVSRRGRLAVKRIELRAENGCSPRQSGFTSQGKHLVGIRAAVLKRHSSLA